MRINNELLIGRNQESIFTTNYIAELKNYLIIGSVFEVAIFIVGDRIYPKNPILLG